jgi:hypothetical protein
MSPQDPAQSPEAGDGTSPATVEHSASAAEHPAHPVAAGEHGFWHGRSALLMPGLVSSMGVELLIPA